jgi:hypothetical protein
LFEAFFDVLLEFVGGVDIQRLEIVAVDVVEVFVVIVSDVYGNRFFPL